MTQIHKAAAHFAGLTTVQDFPTREAAMEWVALRESKGCEATYIGCTDLAAEAEAHQDALCDEANAFVSPVDGSSRSRPVAQEGQQR